MYQSVDAGFGRVLAALPDDADVIVVSPVGMEVNTSRADLLPDRVALALTARLELRGQDWSSTRAFAQPAGDAWALVVPGASRPRPSGRPPRLVDVAATAAALAGADLTDLPGEPLLER